MTAFGRGRNSQVPVRHPRATRWLTRLTWGYATFLLCLWLLLFFAADRWWLATVVMFSPRWVYALPSLLLVPALLLFARPPRRRLLLAAAVGGLVLLFGVMNLCIPWRLTVQPGGTSGARLRVLTLNVDTVSLDAARFRALLDEVNPDVVALQSWRSRHERIAFGTVRGQGGWYLHRDGELLVASRYPAVPVGLLPHPSLSRGNGTAGAYDVALPWSNVRLYNLHLATPRDGLEAVIHEWWGGADEVERGIVLRREQSREASQWAATSTGPTLVVGDFNMPPDSTIYREHWLNYTNAYSAAGFGFGNTHFTPRTSVRIDHVLSGAGWRCRRAWVGPDVGSLHRPVIADLEWVGD